LTYFTVASVAQIRIGKIVKQSGDGLIFGGIQVSAWKIAENGIKHRTDQPPDQNLNLRPPKYEAGMSRIFRYTDFIYLLVLTN
jgi:hypothetical protein